MTTAANVLQRRVPAEIIHLAGVGFAYGPKRVLQGIDLSVSVATVVLLGLSGVGKSTLLRLIRGSLSPLPVRSRCTPPTRALGLEWCFSSLVCSRG